MFLNLVQIQGLITKKANYCSFHILAIHSSLHMGAGARLACRKEAEVRNEAVCLTPCSPRQNPMNWISLLSGDDSPWVLCLRSAVGKAPSEGVCLVNSLGRYDALFLQWKGRHVYCLVQKIRFLGSRFLPGNSPCVQASQAPFRPTCLIPLGVWGGGGGREMEEVCWCSCSLLYCE